MKTFAKMTVASAVALSVGSAFAFPVFVPGMNTLGFQAYENHYRAAADCLSGECLTYDVNNDPVGFQRVNPDLTGTRSVIANDVFAGALYIQTVSPGDYPNNVPTGVKEFTGYFAQKVASINVISGYNVMINFTTTGASGDPFGKLSNNEMYRLYTDTTPDFNPAASQTTFFQIGAATGGGADATFWGSLGLGSEGYAYTLDNLAIAGSNASFAAKFYTALDVIAEGAAYNAGDLNKVNDLSEALVGGVSTGLGVLCSSSDLGSSLVSCTDLAGNADVKRNNFALLGAPFYYNVNDPLVLNRIPEPDSMALLGLGLLGLGAIRRRKSAK